MIRRMIAVALLLLLALFVGAADMPKGRQLTPPYYVFQPDLPHDIVTEDVGAIGFQPFVDNLAWQDFIALNWPAPQPAPNVAMQRGVPDRQNVIGGFKSGGEGGGTTMPNGPTVWETYKDTADIFLNPPVKPAPFDAPEIIPPQCQILALADPRAARRTLSMTAKVSDVLSDFLEAFTLAPLIDQNGQRVWYEVKVNREYYDYVVNNGFYNSENQKGKTIFFPEGTNTTRGAGAVKVKAAWKVIGSGDDPKRFYTTTALLFNPDTKTCTKQQVGLVGLHIVHKTLQLPQWSWATFEQIDNAPDQGKVVPGQKYNFYNPSCTSCPVNRPNKPGDFTTPTQVVRVTPLNAEATSANTAFQGALAALRADNVWQYYELVDDQWAGTRKNIGTPSQPQFLANTTLETYLQGPAIPCSPPHGCINCHGQYAGAKDLDFQLYKAYPHAKTAAKDVLMMVGAPHAAPGCK